MEILSLERSVPEIVKTDTVYSIFYCINRFAEKLRLTGDDYKLIHKELEKLFATAGSLGGETLKDLMVRLETYFYMREFKQQPEKLSLVSPYVSDLDCVERS